MFLLSGLWFNKGVVLYKKTSPHGDKKLNLLKAKKVFTGGNLGDVWWCFLLMFFGVVFWCCFLVMFGDVWWCFFYRPKSPLWIRFFPDFSNNYYVTFKLRNIDYKVCWLVMFGVVLLARRCCLVLFFACQESVVWCQEVCVVVWWCLVLFLVLEGVVWCVRRCCLVMFGVVLLARRCCLVCVWCCFTC